jgi:Ca-activated chloride channel family protein
LLTALAAGAVAAIALAGPAWDRIDVPTFRSSDALVIALDLSRSMDAGDLEPSRLIRARLKLLDLLERRQSGETALVVFSANAFVVTPLTSDTRAIALLASALSTDIMPSQGSLVEVGLTKSAELIGQSSAGQGEILLITDATVSPAALDRAADLRDSGIVTHVLGVGTRDGAPIPDINGGFVIDAQGQVVVPQLNVSNLQRLADAGGGRFAELTIGDGDLDHLLAGNGSGSVTEAMDDEQRESEVWRDRGSVLALALLPFVALGFRRGWVYVVVAGFMLPLPRAEAFEWRDLWQRPDQQGRAALEQDAPAAAAALFEDPEWAAAASYRAGQFEDSARMLQGIDTPAAHYNRGNALASAGALADAVSAYDRALELEPDHADAAFNRELVAELLEQQEQQQQSEAQDSGEQGEQEDQGENGDQQQDEQQSGESSDSGSEQPQSAGASPQPDDSVGDQSEQQDGSGEDAPPEEQLADTDERPETTEEGDQPLQAAAAPEDIEDWASEQAAEQWLRRIPQDPGGLLRRKFREQYRQFAVDQDGNRIYGGGEAEPW